MTARDAASDSPALRAVGVQVHFDGVRAVDGVDLVVPQDRVTGLIGPNGAGKTTLLHALSGFVRPTAGEIEVGTTRLTGAGPVDYVRAGVARTFQDVRLFRGLTVLSNVEVGALAAGLSRRAARARAAELLDLLGLAHLAHAQASAISHGDERKVAVARSAAARPRFLLLDEPAAGLNEGEGRGLVAAIDAIRGELACGILLVDHDMRVVMAACDHIYVLDSGKPLSDGAPEQIAVDETVISAYLGTTAGAHARA